MRPSRKGVTSMRREMSEAAEAPARRSAPTADEVAKIPHDSINEQVIIAACIRDLPTRARFAKILPADGFYGTGHREAWEAIVELERRGLVYDPATVRSIAPGVNTNYLDDLVAARPELPENLDFHVATFHDVHRRMQFGKGPLARIVEALQEPTTETEELRRLCRQVAGAFDGTGSLRFLRDTEAVFESAVKRIEERRERYRSGHVGHPYGIDGLDLFEDGTARIVSGMAPGEMTLVVGESGSGKTTFTNQVVLAQVNQKKHVLHGAWEQDGEDNLEMLAAFSLGLPRARLRIGAIGDEEADALRAEMARIRAYVKFFELPFNRSRDRKQRPSNESNLDVIHEHMDLAGCRIGIFDLIAKAFVSSKPEDEKLALDRMLGIAKETRTHLILLHHLNKAELRDRPDRRPTREAIKGSTAWVDAFDTILGLYIPDKWKPIHANTMEVHVLKQRNGIWPLAVEFDYDATTGRIRNGRSFDLMSVYAEPPDGSVDKWLAEEEQSREKKGKKRGR
jgi:replicative DNA helicase